MHHEEPGNQETKPLEKGLKYLTSDHNIKACKLGKWCKIRKKKPDNQYPLSPFLVACVPVASVSIFCCPLFQYKPAWESVR